MNAEMGARQSLLPLKLTAVVWEAGGRRIIDRVSFALDAGPSSIIVGPNGAGKSVLLRLCHGLLQPAAGSIAWSVRCLARVCVLGGRSSWFVRWSWLAHPCGKHDAGARTTVFN